MRGLSLFIGCALILSQFAGAAPKRRSCPKTVAIAAEGPDVKPLPFDFPNLEIASLIDPTRSTGATLFHFPHGAYANVDVRGGAVAAIETTLLDEGSYSNMVDGVLFTGGSTMGLEASCGVREVLFTQRQDRRSEFDFIPTVPGAVVFDYGGRTHRGADPFVYPTRELGAQLIDHLDSTFYLGRAGAGRTTTVNKVGEPYWGGQGAALSTHKWGRVFAAVVLNALGDVKQNGVSLGKALNTSRSPRHRQNTTLSIVITDVPLDRSQLKRLAVMVHTSMAEFIQPFHTPYDGDILFAVSTEKGGISDEETEYALQMEARKLMKEAILASVRTANQLPEKDKKTERKN